MPPQTKEEEKPAAPEQSLPPVPYFKLVSIVKKRKKKKKNESGDKREKEREREKGREMASDIC